MTFNLTNTNTEQKITQLMLSVLAYFLTKKENSVTYNTLNSWASVFKINVDQLNEFYNKIFITSATGQILDERIMELTSIKRNDNETDDNYRNRYYKWIYQYNSTLEQVLEIVKDVTGSYPAKILEGNSRTAFWGTENNMATGLIIDTRYYYDEENLDYQTLWGGTGEKAFISYIYLISRPSDNILIELMDTLEKVRNAGTIIYLVLPQVSDVIFEFDMSSNLSQRILSLNNSPENDFVIQDSDVIFEWSMIENTVDDIQDYSGNNNNGNLNIYIDESAIFYLILNELNLNDFTNNSNNFILDTYTIITYIEESIFTYLMGDGSGLTISDSSLNTNNMTINEYFESALFMWELKEYNPPSAELLSAYDFSPLAIIGTVVNSLPSTLNYSAYVFDVNSFYDGYGSGFPINAYSSFSSTPANGFIINSSLLSNRTNYAIMFQYQPNLIQGVETGSGNSILLKGSTSGFTNALEFGYNWTSHKFYVIINGIVVIDQSYTFDLNLIAPYWISFEKQGNLYSVYVNDETTALINFSDSNTFTFLADNLKMGIDLNGRLDNIYVYGNDVSITTRQENKVLASNLNVESVNG